MSWIKVWSSVSKKLVINEGRFRKPLHQIVNFICMLKRILSVMTLVVVMLSGGIAAFAAPVSSIVHLQLVGDINDPKIELTWESPLEDPTQVDYDLLRFDLTENKKENSADINLSGVTTFVDGEDPAKPLIGGHSYGYVLVAFDKEGNFIFNYTQAEIKLVTNILPMNFTATFDDEKNEVLLDWDEPVKNFSTSYEIGRLNDMGGNSIIFEDITDTFYPDDTVKDGEKLIYLLIAKDDTGQQIATDGPLVVDLSLNPELKVVQTIEEPLGIELSWKNLPAPSGDEAGLRYQLMRVSSSSPTPIEVFNQVNVAGHIDNQGLEEGKKYFYALNVYDGEKLVGVNQTEFVSLIPKTEIEIVPVSAVLSDVNGNSQVDTFRITFDKPVVFVGDVKSYFSVENRTVESVTIEDEGTNKLLTVKLVESGSHDLGVKVKGAYNAPNKFTQSGLAVTGDDGKTSYLESFSFSGIVANDTVTVVPPSGGGLAIIIKKEPEETEVELLGENTGEEEGDQGEPAVELLSEDIAEPCTDTDGHFAADAINLLRLKGVWQGKSPGICDPNGMATRAEILKIALLTFDHAVAEVESGFDVKTLGSDVMADHWAVKYMATGKKLKIMEGYVDGTMKADQQITRAEALKIFLIASGVTADEIEEEVDVMQLAGTIDLPKGKDVMEKDWFYDVAVYAFIQKIVQGYEDGTFKGNGNVSRGEAAVMATNIMALEE